VNVKKNKVIIIGHRGASNIAPENTLKAFRKAIELKADFIEFDVLESRDGELVISHDEEISRLTGRYGFVRDLTLEELKTFDFGEGEKIPTLQELIEITKGKINLNCEVIVKGISNKVIKILKKYDLTDSVLISSFKREELLKFQKIDPTVKLAYLDHNNYESPCSWDKKEEWIQFCINNKLYAINPFYPLVNQQFVDFAHDNNIKIFPFTVDSGPAMRKLIKFGVDGIITNDVEKVRELLNRKK